jgi:hypothetical protein
MNTFLIAIIVVLSVLCLLLLGLAVYLFYIARFFGELVLIPFVGEGFFKRKKDK